MGSGLPRLCRVTWVAITLYRPSNSVLGRPEIQLRVELNSPASIAKFGQELPLAISVIPHLLPTVRVAGTEIFS
jgi:hypothetical protein